MKRVVLTVIVVLATLGSMFLSPANATDEDDWAARGCAAETSKVVTRTLSFSGGDADEQVNYAVRVYYRDCGTSAFIRSMTITIDPEFNGCLNAGYYGKFVQNYKVNPDTIGNWNLGERTWDCISGVGTYAGVYSNPATNKYVFASDPENIRCLRAHVQVSLDNVGDPDGYTNRVCFA
jgi:hypothetical protein